MAATPPVMTLCPQDFEQPLKATVSLSETSLESNSTPASASTEAAPGDDKKSNKKRKSWGQELPTPKTNLPPRKRAKTEDEKEQRRIERVLRNRAAAQSSRERKRLEVEKLEGQKSTIEQQNQYLKDRLMAAEHEKFLLAQQVAKLSAQIKSLKDGTADPASIYSPPHTPSSTVSMTDVAGPVTATATTERQVSPAFDAKAIKQEIEDGLCQASIVAPSATATAIPTPPQSFASPSTMTFSPSQSPSQPSLVFVDDEPSHTTPSPDLTQHPAAMLCSLKDLQCQSGKVQVSTTVTPNRQQQQQQRQSTKREPFDHTSRAIAIQLSLATTSTALVSATIAWTLMTPIWACLAAAAGVATTTPFSTTCSDAKVLRRQQSNWLPTTSRCPISTMVPSTATVLSAAA